MPRISFPFGFFSQQLRAPICRSISVAAILSSPAAATTKMNSSSTDPPNHRVRPYTPANPDMPFPYTKSDLTAMDPSPDPVFYSQPRFVTHIDDNAIIELKQYYDICLPKSTLSESSRPDSSSPALKAIRILDVCSSWVSHYPPRITKAATIATASTSIATPSSKTTTQDIPETPSASTTITSTRPAPPAATIECYGTGLNAAELSANPVLNPTASGRDRDGETIAERRWWVQDLNAQPELQLPEAIKSKLQLGREGNTTEVFDATTLVVSIDYLTSPLPVLASILSRTLPGGTIHLAVSNRCFPTKAVRRWLEVSENERLEMVGDYLWWSGWRDIEIVEVVEKQEGWVAWKDPLWVVRGRKVGDGHQTISGK